MGIEAINDINQEIIYALNRYQTTGNTMSFSGVGTEIKNGEKADTVEISVEAKKALSMDKALERSAELMQIRGLNKEEISAFRDILSDYEQSELSAQEYLKSLKGAQRDLVKRANSYGSDLIDERIDFFSNEGAENMLNEQDYRFAIDLNGDDVVEKGAGKTFVFPPADAPEAVKDAWDTLSENMTSGEKMLFSGLFLPVNIPEYPDATTIRGYNLNQQGFPETANGYLELLDKVYETLEYNNKFADNSSMVEHNKRSMEIVKEFKTLLEAKE